MDNAIGKATSGISNFLKLESAGGLLLGAAAILALICSNSPLRVAYDDLLKFLSNCALVRSRLQSRC